MGKAFLALLALQLVDAGRIGLDDPVAAVGPSSGPAAGGGDLRHTLCHRASVPAIREPLTDEDLSDWQRMTGALAATDAVVGARDTAAYHTNTYGHLIGEIVRRLSGEGVRPPPRRSGRPARGRRARRCPAVRAAAAVAR